MIEERLDARKKALVKKQVENETLQKQIEALEEAIVQAAKKLQLGQEALQFLEDVANSRRGMMKSQIENIVSEALACIYGPDYRIELEYDVKNNRSCMDIVLVKKTEEGEVRALMESFGGGVSDTISVPLRLLVLLAARQTDKVCLLDEPYKHVDLERIDRVAGFVRDVTDKLGLQTIMLSHHEAMKEVVDRCYYVEDDNGKSVVSQQK